MKRLIALGVAMVLMLAVPVLAEEEKTCEYKLLELEEKYQQTLANAAELATRLISAQRKAIIFEDGLDSFTRKEITAVQNRSNDRRGPLVQSQRALKNYLRNLEEEEKKGAEANEDSKDPGPVDPGM